MYKSLSYLRTLLFITSFFLVFRYLRGAGAVYIIGSLIPILQIIIYRKVWVLRILHIVIACGLPPYSLYISITVNNKESIPWTDAVFMGAVFLYLCIAPFIENAIIKREKKSR